MGRAVGYQRILILKRKPDQISNVELLSSDSWHISKTKPYTFSYIGISDAVDQPQLVLRFSTSISGQYFFVCAHIKRILGDPDTLETFCSREREYGAALPSKSTARSRASQSGHGHVYLDVMIPGEAEAIRAKLETKFVYNQSVSTISIYSHTNLADAYNDDDANSVCSNEAYAA